MPKTVILAIMDGWGVGEKNESNPIYMAKPQTIQYIEDNYPAGSLKASGYSVGLPWGEEGNSEVGHLTIGAGRILYQHYLRITKAIEEGSFFTNPALINACTHIKQTGGALHLIGLLTDATVHASFDHLVALLKLAKQQQVSHVYLHLFSDGRDTPPKHVGVLLQKLNQVIANQGVGALATLAGRFYGMDRDKHWERTKQVYDILIHPRDPIPTDTVLAHAYDKRLSDEYILPSTIEPHPVSDGDAIIFFNFREDRMRQLSAPFIQDDFTEFPAQTFQNIYLATMTGYHQHHTVPVAFPQTEIPDTLGETLATQGKNQLRVAETEKYAHVTYFFNGLHEQPFQNEYRVLIPSRRIAHHDEHPEMMASEITERVLVSLQGGGFSFVLLNYANTDMVAHTGNYRATMKAVEVVDNEINRLARDTLAQDNILLITSDHGNAEVLLDPQTGEQDTKHNASPVPLYVVGNKFKRRTQTHDSLPIVGMLSDIAPTVLELLEIPQPEAMNGSSLLGII